MKLTRTRLLAAALLTVVPAAVALSVAVPLAGCGGRASDSSGPTPATAAVAPAGPPWFEDVTAASGIASTYRNGEDIDPPHLAILESLGGGAAALDFDGDGRIDLYFPGGGYYDGPDKKTIRGHAGKLYRNLGDFKFEDVTGKTGLGKLADGPWFYSHGAAACDYDEDGRPDLLVTGWGRVALLHNEPDGKGGRKFTDATAGSGLDKGITWATSAAWADFDGDGLPDLYLCQYVDWSFDNHPKCNYDGKTPDVCPPKKFRGLPHKLFRNLGGGKFEDVSKAAGLHQGETGPHSESAGMSKGLGCLAVDVNGDGKPDVYTTNDTVPNFLYVNKSTPGAIRFEERGMLSGTAMDGTGAPNGSMGADAGDPFGSGKPAIWCTNYENELHALYRNKCEGDRVRFLFATQESGIAAIGQKYVGWGTGFIDFDRDGWEDLFVVDGHAVRYPTGAPRRQKPVLLRNTGGGKFADISAQGGEYFHSPHLGRGLVLADLDNDGRVDAVVVHTNEPAAVLRNVAPASGKHWVGVKLVGAAHADVVGARVTLTAGGRSQHRFAKGGGSYLSTPDRRLLFGIGDAKTVSKLAVTWPDGKTQEWTEVPLDRYLTVTQGEAALK